MVMGSIVCMRVAYTRCNRGVAAIEFAIVAPVMVFILFGIVAYGVFFGAAHSVQQLAANSARAAMGGYSQEEREMLVRQHVSATVSSDSFLQEPYLDVRVEDISGQPDFIRVTVTYDASGLPIWSLYDGLPLPEKIITRTAVIRMGGY